MIIVTIRKFLMNRFFGLWPWYLALFGQVVLVIEFAPKNNLLLFVSMAVMFGGLVALVIWMRRTPCPRCGLPLGSAALIGSSMRKAAQEAFCPNCGVSIDESIEERPRPK